MSCTDNMPFKIWVFVSLGDRKDCVTIHFDKASMAWVCRKQFTYQGFAGICIYDVLGNIGMFNFKGKSWVIH